MLLFEGKAVIRISCNTKEISNESFSFALPGSSCVIGQRRARRHACHGIVAEFIQGKPRTMGILWDFSPLGFRVSLSAESSRICRSFDEDLPVFVVLRRDQTVLFSGVCRYIRGHIGIGQGEVVVTSSESNTKGSSKIEVRSPRIRMKPCPYMDFDHPIVGKGMRFEIFDISTSGLSVYESGDESVLMPGMRISELKLYLSGSKPLNCSGKVIYRVEEQKNKVRCGIQFTDMDIMDFSSLSHLLVHTQDPRAHVSTSVDMDALWEFFFDSGFLYPEKYRNIQLSADELKKTYNKMYDENCEIARHFTYRENSRIFAHMSMVRAYDKTWMIQHHATRSMNGRRVGLDVLRDVTHYLLDMHRLPSANMEYLMCYFRPESEFPMRVFGGFAESKTAPRFVQWICFRI